MKRSLEERLAENYIPEPNSGCWLWLGTINNWGYGNIAVKKDGRWTTLAAHRAMYEALVGPIDEGLQIDHECRNRGCVNPSHLEPVTARENNMRGTGVAAMNAGKTHCDYGHAFTPENLKAFPSDKWTKNKRRCLTCWNERTYPSILAHSKARYARRKLAAAS